MSLQGLVRRNQSGARVDRRKSVVHAGLSDAVALLVLVGGFLGVGVGVPELSKLAVSETSSFAFT